MTNIGTIKVNKSRDQKNPVIICVADSMASNSRDKTDENQKLFITGKNIIMGTGPSEPIIQISRRLEANPATCAQEAAEQAYEMAKSFNLDPDTYLNFFVSGQKRGEEPDVESYHLITGGPEKQRGISLFERGFDGSGMPHVVSYDTGALDSGTPLSMSTEAEAIVTAQDYAKKAARNAGVNDKLQFGVVRPGDVNAIFHPDIRVADDYEALLLGRQIPPLNLTASQKEFEKISEERRALGTVSESAFTNLNDLLGAITNTRRAFNYFAGEWRDGKNSRAKVEFIREHYQQLREATQHAVKRVFSHDLEKIVAFNRDCEDYRREQFTKALSYKNE